MIEVIEGEAEDHEPGRSPTGTFHRRPSSEELVQPDIVPLGTRSPLDELATVRASILSGLIFCDCQNRPLCCSRR